MRNNLLAGAIFCGLAVAFGAFGAHSLEMMTTDQKLLHGYQTGVTYQFYHGLALLIVGMLRGVMDSKFLRWAGICFIVGILLFSGSLYMLTLLKIQGSSAAKIFGPITPLGGVAFIAGWALLLIAFKQRKS